MPHTDTRCRDLLEGYSELVDDRLPGSEAMRLWAHVGSCPSCARYHRVIQGGVAVLRDQELETPPGFHDRLRSRIERQCVCGPLPH